jgi:uncharacterized phiE125 gp8 family phage protein
VGVGVTDVVVFPTVALVSLSEMKAHLRVDDSATGQNDLIEAAIAAATEYVDAEFGCLGRALTTQTLSLTLPCFPSERDLSLPVAPVQSVSSITYYDADNVQQTLSASDYRVVLAPNGATIELEQSSSWPSSYQRLDAVVVTYVAGYGNAASDVPFGIRQAVKMIAAHYYENAEAVGDSRMAEMPMGASHILRKYRLPEANF